MLKGVIFDLDQTLIDTSALRAYREAGAWGTVERRLDLAKPFSLADSIQPHELPESFKASKLGIAVVTSSPRHIAEKLLARFRIPYDVLVGHGDADRAKPFPDPFQKALDDLGISANEAFAVGDHHNDTEGAFHAKLFSVGAGWGIEDWSEYVRLAPDMTFFKPSLLRDLKQYPNRRYLSDVMSGEHTFTGHRGSVLWLGPKKSDGFCLGRYFNRTDSRHVSCAFSKRIQACKKDGELMSEFAHALLFALEQSKLISSYKIITCVPPKPGEINRFSQLLDLLKSHAEGALNTYPDGLFCTGPYDSLKRKNPSERIREVAGKFGTGYRWGGHNVILLDDVHTTSATTNECVRVLKKNGAGNVLVVGIAKDQRTIDRQFCPRCGELLVTNYRKSDRRPFLGCTGWRYGDPSSCQYKQDCADESSYV